MFRKVVASLLRNITQKPYSTCLKCGRITFDSTGIKSKYCDNCKNALENKKKTEK